ncbi:hypothetical protein M8J76_005474 [Diaphorina citri]|nr:hypothetical protein M8J75_001450 [Diaphorina citri]KAI5744812.1 hypothetical protein M8J76_005474 [Diaphorina citri]KAI5752708.1 hypothetical protein M8J77_019643 [Diaphorina citri]
MATSSNNKRKWDSSDEYEVSRGTPFLKKVTKWLEDNIFDNEDNTSKESSLQNLAITTESQLTPPEVIMNVCTCKFCRVSRDLPQAVSRSPLITFPENVCQCDSCRIINQPISPVKCDCNICRQNAGPKATIPRPLSNYSRIERNPEKNLTAIPLPWVVMNEKDFNSMRNRETPVTKIIPNYGHGSNLNPRCSNNNFPSQCSTCGRELPYIQGEFHLEYMGFKLLNVKYFVPKNGLANHDC